jgi:hypothetical protein
MNQDAKYSIIVGTRSMTPQNNILGAWNSREDKIAKAKSSGNGNHLYLVIQYTFRVGASGLNSRISLERISTWG